VWTSINGVRTFEFKAQKAQTRRGLLRLKLQDFPGSQQSTVDDKPIESDWSKF